MGKQTRYKWKHKVTHLSINQLNMCSTKKATPLVGPYKRSEGAANMVMIILLKYIIQDCIINYWTAIDQSVLRLATGWTVRGSNSDGSEIFPTRPDRSWGPPRLLYNGYRVSFARVKRPGNGFDHPPPPSVEVKERVQLYLYSSSRLSWPVLGWSLPSSSSFFFFL